MNRYLCSYCGQTGHSAGSCPRRARNVKVAVAETLWIAALKPKRPAVVEYKKRRKPSVDPKRHAAWLADLEAINGELAT